MAAVFVDELQELRVPVGQVGWRGLDAGHLGVKPAATMGSGTSRGVGEPEMRQRVASGPGRENSTSFSLSIPCISMSMLSQPTLGSHSHHLFAIKLLQNRGSVTYLPGCQSMQCSPVHHLSASLVCSLPGTWHT